MLSNEYILSARVGFLFRERGLSNIDKTTNIDKTSAWSLTEQCAEFAMKIVDYAKSENVTIDTAMDEKADEYIDLVNESCEYHGWDDYCRGFIVGTNFRNECSNCIKSGGSLEQQYEYWVLSRLR